MTVLHSTEPATVHLSLHARVDGLTVADVEKALYVDRSLVKQLAMRRTLFVFPRDLLPAAWGSASSRVAGEQAARIARDVEKHGIADDGDVWVEAACAAVRSRLSDGSALSATRLREELPELEGRITVDLDKKYGGTFTVAPRVLVLLGARGEIVRAGNDGHWRISRPTWAAMTGWLGEAPQPLPEREGYAELARRWLFTFGPATTLDLQWWLGSTKGAAVRALGDIGAVAVGLDGGEGWLLADDLDEVADVEPWAALLPVLDATVMGWKQREFFLGPHAPALFDTNGNAGTTAWWAGRVVGCWVQDADGVVQLRLLEKVPAAGRAALQAEADRLTGWLGGQRVSTVYSAPAMKG